MIQLNDLSKFYMDGQKRREILKQVNLKIATGEFIMIIGASGSGKSTLLNILGGLDSQSNGEYIFEEELVINSKDRDRIRRNKSSYVLQNFALIPNLTIKENIVLSPNKIKIDEVYKVLDVVGLEGRLNERIMNLSGGEKQRVALARALVRNTNLILADEPTGALDTENTTTIMQLFKKINETGKTIVIATHNSELLHYADRIILIQNGQIKEV